MISGLSEVYNSLYNKHKYFYSDENRVVLARKKLFTGVSETLRVPKINLPTQDKLFLYVDFDKVFSKTEFSLTCPVICYNNDNEYFVDGLDEVLIQDMTYKNFNNHLGYYISCCSNDNLAFKDSDLSIYNLSGKVSLLGLRGTEIVFMFRFMHQLQLDSIDLLDDRVILHLIYNGYKPVDLHLSLSNYHMIK